MSGLVGGLLGGGEDQPQATAINTVQVPSWLDSRNKGLAKRAETASKAEFTPYTGQRVAEFTPDTQTAFDLSRNATGRYQDLLTSTSNSVYDLIRRAQGPTTSDIQQYMNPYLDNVLDISKRGTIDEFNRQQAARDQEAGLINAFGGSRVAIRQALADEQLAEDIQDLDYRGRFDAFNNAQNQFNVGTEALSTGISQGLNTATQGQAYDQADIGQLLRQGELQRLREQDELDFDYQEFDREQAFPYENVNFLANILNPLTGAYAGGQTTQTQQTGGSGGSSTLGNIAGIASSVASIAGLFSDERVKENIEQVGELDNGLPVYSYNYVGDDTPQIGLIAQDVEQVKPEAVGEVEGIKTVDYGQAVEMRDGGPVSSNLASKARLAPVSPTGRPSFPGLPSLPLTTSSTPEIDALGLEELLSQFNDSDYSFTKGDGNMLSRLFKGGLDGIDEDNYTSPIGPTRIPNPEGFYGLDSQVSPPINFGSFLSSFGFKDGGAVTDFRKKLRELRDYTQEAGISDENSKMGNVGRHIVNSIASTPAALADTLLAPVEGLENFGEWVHPKMVDAFLRPEKEVKTRNLAEEAAAAEQAKTSFEKVKKEASLKDDIGALLGKDQPLTPEDLENRPLTEADLRNFDRNNVPGLAPVEESLLQDEPRPSNTQRRNTLQYPNLPPWLTPTAPQQPKEEPNSKGINMPLLIAGLTMLATEGDSGDKLMAGLSTGTRAAGDAKRRKLEEAKVAADLKRQQFQDYIAYIKAQAYIEQVRQNAEKGNGLTPYQAGRLRIQEEKLKLEERKLEEKIKGGSDGGLDFDPTADLDVDAVEDLLRELAE